eukprot:COSAG04_NODE_31_length_35649_cov_21.693052_18_plen_328_part_00
MDVQGVERRTAAILRHLAPAPAAAVAEPEPAAPSPAADHRLTAAQEVSFRRDGYLHLKRCIPAELVGRCLDAVNQMVAEYEQERPEKHGTTYTIIQTLLKSGGTNGALDELMDLPSLFPTILDLMGPYIQVMGSQIYVRYPQEGSKMLSGWHTGQCSSSLASYSVFLTKLLAHCTDAGPSLGQIHVTEDSLPINLKVQFFLTPIPVANAANFALTPGSHRTPLPEPDEREAWTDGDPPGALQLICEPGDVAIFPNTLWHGVAPSFALDEEGQGVRRSVTLRYGQMWSRPYLLRPIFLLILSPFRSTDLFGGGSGTTIRSARPTCCSG